MTASRRKLVLLASIALSCAVGAAACVSSVDDEPKQVVEHDQVERKGPVRVVIDAALSQSDVSTELRATLTAVRDRVELERADKGKLKQELRASAGDIIRAGTADTEQFDEAVDQAMGALEARVLITRTALAEVHGLLSPEQRAGISATLHEHIAHRFAEHERRAKRRKRFKRVAAHLMLTGVQLDKLEQVRHELIKDSERLHPTRAQLDRLVDAFAGDDFVTLMDAFHERKLAIMRRHLAKFGGHADSALSLLQVEQRELLAELVELGPAALGLEEQQRAAPSNPRTP